MAWIENDQGSLLLVRQTAGRRSPSVLSQQNANRRKARCLKWQKLARKLFYPDFDFWLLRLVAYAFFGPIPV
jgi:hypothetical protein